MNTTIATQDSMLRALSTVLPPHTALMVVGPLTSSKAIHAASDPAERDRLQCDNEKAITQLADRLREEQGRPVVNPSVLVVDGWSLDDYRRFFLDVLARFVRCAYFIRGWEYSQGVTAEFLLCREVGVECRDDNGDVIADGDAIALLQAANRHLRDEGKSFDWMAERTAAFSGLLVQSHRGLSLGERS
ncbi:hypothetical protein [Streptomyces sp. NPDC093060]|uniref:hypothetical protein n=1 Tax=Streptomyces sp. NPDC093060 TaxID=3366019 RepID=UPI003814FC68